MKKDLKEFMENVNIINKNLCEYLDDKGTYAVLGTAQLLTNCEYLELDEKQLKMAYFNQEIEKLDYNKEIVKRKVLKSEITGKKEDETTIIEKDVEVSQIWVVRNQLRVSKSFTDKNSALDFAKNINNQVIEALGE